MLGVIEKLGVIKFVQLESRLIMYYPRGWSLRPVVWSVGVVTVPDLVVCKHFGEILI